MGVELAEVSHVCARAIDSFASITSCYTILYYII